MNVKEFNRHIDKLEKSPVYAMSLGSKELFHSNLWKWIMDQDWGKPFIEAFFPAFDINQSNIKIERENKNRDLVIFDTSGNEYVIENKIKSYPDKWQLEKYTRENPKMVKGVITGINEPPFKCEKWNFVSYSKIADKLRALNILDSRTKQLIDEYCDLLESINVLMSEAMNEKPNVLSYWTENIKDLEKVHLMDVFRKLKADDFVKNCGDIESKYTKLVEQKCSGFHFYIDRSFHNKEATISFVIQKGDEKKYKGQVGVQIEGNQFRLFLGLTYGDARSISELAQKYKWHDSSYDKKTNRQVFGYSTKMKNSYCSYSGRWVYQYFDTWNKEFDIQGYDELKKQLDYFLTRAVKIVSEYGNEIFK